MLEELTNAQKSIWVTEQYYKGSSVNNICGTAIIEEKVNFEKLEKAINIVCQKHDNFKLKLKIKNGDVKQELSENKNCKIDIFHVANLRELEKIRKEIVKKPFILENSLLFKFYIFKFANGQGAFMLNIHHLIADAWTLAFICNEIIKTYSALKQNQEIETKAIYSYIDYINSEKEYLKSEKYQNDKKYWIEKYQTIPEVAVIPGSKHENLNTTDIKGERTQFSVKKEEVDKIKAYCKENKISVYNFFMAIFAIYIAEITNLDDFVIGTPILNRTNYKEKNAAGMFINMAPLRINFKEDIQFKEFVKNIAIDSMSMLKHQKYSYQSLLEELRKENSNIPNLYNILLSYQITNAQMSGGDIKYKTEWTFNECCADDLDIQIYDINDTGNLNVAYDYKKSMYSRKDIENLNNRILYIIKQVVTQDNIKVQDIDIVTQEEKEKIIKEFNETELKYDENVPIIKYFEEQVCKQPNDIAVVFENIQMTYKELNEKANSLAHTLRENGVKNNTIVGIMEERSFEMIIAILAVLKSGGCYIPIAPDYPNERTEYMISDSNAEILLTSKQNRINTNKKVININLNNSEIYSKNKENIENITKPQDLSYIIYTSGSTGTPKGVMLMQKNLTNFYHAMEKEIEYLRDGKKHKIISTTTVSFDIFEFETLISLTKGLTVYMTNENEQKMTEEIEKIIQKNNIEILQTTPSIMKFHLENLKDRQNLSSLKYIMLAGEPLPKRLVDKLKHTIEDIRIYNGYGPSETTIFSTTRNVTDLKKITIGKPIVNTQIYILNKNAKVLPQGVPGEIYISGDGVGKGYINKKKQTEANFLKNKFAKGVMYKVGDIGTFSENGEIICYGRIDNQVKIRGLRIELDEIEKQVLSIYNISDCIVVKKNINSRDVLCAYYTQKGPVEESVIKILLKNRLPQYMIPQYFIKMEKLPHTPNGKIDKKSLPEPNIQELDREFIKIRNKTDEEIIKMIKKMLYTEQISLSDTLLDLGGDSLTAITLSTKILSKFNVQINVKDLLSNYTIKDISDYINNNQSEENTRIKIEKAPVQELYPLSTAQKRIYYNSKMIGDENVVYNLPGAILVEDILDRGKVKKIFEKIIERHEILRTSFVIKEDNVFQKLEDKIDFEIPIYNNHNQEIKDIVNHFSKPFKLEKAPLIRVELHYIDKKKTLLLLESHHIVMDGTGLNNLIIEFNRLYNEQNLKKIPIQYKDYAVWENEFNKSKNIEKYEQYWVNKFKDSELSQLNLPYDYKIPAKRSYKGDKISNEIDEVYFRKIERYAKKIGVSPYMFFITIFFVLLYKYTGQNDITLGSPIANRNINETKRMIGMFGNNIVIRGKINPDMTFMDFLNEIKNQILDDLSNQPYPFDMLIKKLGKSGDTSRNPLFDILFTYQNKEENIIKIGEKNCQVIELNNNIAKFNLSVEIKPNLHTINFEYCTDLFRNQTIKTMLNHYLNAIEIILNKPNIKLKDINIIGEKEKNKILFDFNKTEMSYEIDKTISQLIEEQVRKKPNNEAIVFEDESITYDELNKRANQIANYLRKQNIKPNDIIGIMIPRSIELLTAIIAVLKAGACYIPIDPAYPEKRIEYMLENSNAKIVLTTNKLFNNLNFISKVCVDFTNNDIYLLNNENLKNINMPDDMSYIIYTSGSTGLPKGVILKHKSLTNLCFYLNKKVEFLQDNCIYKNMASITTVSFDIFIFETLICLQKGLKIVLANEEEQRIPKLLNNLIKKNNVQLIQMTPSRMKIFLDNIEDMPNLSNLKYVTLAGEPLPLKLRDDLLKLGVKKIFNGYGPSETTIFSTFTDVTDSKEINIGKPIANTQMYILDKNLQIVPIGVAGELYIAGDGVGKGYLNMEETTKERYMNDPFIDGNIMYKTGDICKYDINGDIYYLGRTDNQVKIRGLRIELEEIENQILNFPFIKDAKVVKQTIGNREIISAYFIAKRRIRITELRKYLNESLPNYMIPSYFTALDEFPHTPNGKIDKKALPIPSGVLQNQKNKYVAPKTDLEVKLVSIWEDVLNTKPIGINDNFFELGGDSILAMNLNIQLLKITNKIKYSDIFTYPTISSMVEKIQKEKEETKEENLEYLNKEYKEILNNNMKVNQEIQYHPINNVLLVGVTGFLGIHILQELLTKENSKIYVLIRKEPGLSIKEKLLSKMHYYFEEKYDSYLYNRIIPIEGDFSKDGFGLNQEDLFNLGNSIDIIINSAGKVSHYGNYQDFYNINVKSVEKIIDFANTFKKKVFHISTLSVSGNAFVDQYYMEQNFNKEVEFCENNFYIGQSLENVYIRSKFEAERRIFEAILKGTEAYIIRVGNLMPRRSDGKFQENATENAYISRLKAFVKMKCIPDYLLNGYLEFTPIDSTAQAILKIMQYTNEDNKIYHVFNNNHVKIHEVLNMLPELSVISGEEFKQKIKKILNSSKSDIVDALINDLDKDLNLHYDSKIKINSNHSLELLKLYGFKWPKIDKRYLENILKLIEGENNNDNR